MPSRRILKRRKRRNERAYRQAARRDGHDDDAEKSDGEIITDARLKTAWERDLIYRVKQTPERRRLPFRRLSGHAVVLPGRTEPDFLARRAFRPEEAAE